MIDEFAVQISALVKQRAENVEGRLRKLVDAGVPIERLFLLSDPTCECAGTGIVLSDDADVVRGYECPRCLGVGMIEVRR